MVGGGRWSAGRVFRDLVTSEIVSSVARSVAMSAASGSECMHIRFHVHELQYPPNRVYRIEANP